MEAPFGRMLMCHMMADTHAELVDMADRIGVARKWIQQGGNPVHEHFDIAKSKRAIAVRLGAIEIEYGSELARLLEQRRKPEHREAYFEKPGLGI